MKLIIIAAIGVLGSSAAYAQGSHYVQGHTTRSGNYVSGHYATNPNSTKLDNYSTQGNMNPYTGQSGTVDPYRSTQSNPTGSPYNSGRSRSGWPN